MLKPHRELHNPHERNPVPVQWVAGAVWAPEPNWRFLIRDNPFLTPVFEYKTVQPVVTIVNELSKPSESLPVTVTLDCILNIICLWRHPPPLFQSLYISQVKGGRLTIEIRFPDLPNTQLLSQLSQDSRSVPLSPLRRPILCPAPSESCFVEGRCFNTKRCSGRGRNPHPRSHQLVTTLCKRLSNSLWRHWFLRTI
jgi:hypothetical protein